MSFNMTAISSPCGLTNAGPNIIAKLYASICTQNNTHQSCALSYNTYICTYENNVSICTCTGTRDLKGIASCRLSWWFMK